MKLNVKSVFKTNIDDKEKFIELFNYKLAKIILCLESKMQNGEKF